MKITMTSVEGLQLTYEITDNEQDNNLLSLWLDGKAEKTITAYTQDCKKLILWLKLAYPVDGKPLTLISLADVQNFKKSLIAEGLQPSTQRRILSCIRSLIDFGAKLRMYEFNFAAVVKLPKFEDTTVERIASEEAIMSILEEEKNQRNHAMLSLLYHGGLRSSELSRLQWRNLVGRGDAGQVTLFGKRSKTRAILLDADTWRELITLRPQSYSLDGYIFTVGQQNTRLSLSAINKIVQRAAIRAGVGTYTEKDGKLSTHFSPHWFRHAHSSHAQEHGAPIALVQKTLGHKSIATTARYTHVRPDQSSANYLK